MRCVELHAAEQPVAAEMQVEQAEHAALGQAAGEFLELVELAGEIAAADQRADRGAGDHVDLDAGLVERAQHADMRPAAGGAAAERQRDARISLPACVRRAGRRAGQRRESLDFPRVGPVAHGRPVEHHYPLFPSSLIQEGRIERMKLSGLQIANGSLGIRYVSAGSKRRALPSDSRPILPPAATIFR